MALFLYDNVFPWLPPLNTLERVASISSLPVPAASPTCLTLSASRKLWIVAERLNGFTRAQHRGTQDHSAVRSDNGKLRLVPGSLRRRT